MALYLNSLKLDRETGDSPTIVLNATDAQREGINQADIVNFDSGEIAIFAVVEITDTEIPPGVVGVYEEIWTKYTLPNDTVIAISVMERPESIEYIKKKLLGERLTEHELAVITKDISDR